MLRCSADGTLAAFAASKPLEGRAVGLSVIPVDGGEAAALTPETADGLVPFDDYPSFSPDGRQIVYQQVSAVSDQGEALTGAMVIIDVSGGTPRRISPDVQFPGPPRFSPDGTRILFSAANSNGSDMSLWVVPASGGDPTELFPVPSHASAFHADWSPNGTELVFEWYEDGWDRNEPLRRVDSDGRRLLIARQRTGRPWADE